MEHTNKGFVLGNDKDDDTEIPVKKDIHDLHVEKLSHRVTLITILIPILIGIIGYFIYNDIQKKVTRVHDTGTTEFKTLSEDLASKFSSLSVQLSTFEEETRKTIKSMDETISVLKKDMSSVSQKYSSTDKRVDQANAASAQISKKVDAVLKDLVALQEVVGNEKKHWDDAIGDFRADITTTKKEIDTLNGKIDKISSSKLDRDTFIAELNKLNEALGNLSTNVKQKVSGLEAKVDKLSIARPATTVKDPSEKSQPSTEEVRMIRTPPATQSPSPPSGLQEQDIQE